jgi:hypothetical protein
MGEASHARGNCSRGNQEKGLLQGPQRCQRGLCGVMLLLVKKANAALAMLDRTTSKGTGSSRKASKKPKETAVTASQPDPDLQAEYVSDIKQAKEAAEKAKAKAELAATDMFQLNASLLFIDAKYNSSPTWTYKAVLRRDPGDIHASNLATASYSTSTVSTCFPTTRLSRRGTTSQTCSRNPSASVCISLCSMSNGSTSTSRNCHAGSTALVPTPVQFP